MGRYTSDLFICCMQDLFADTCDAQSIEKRVGDRWDKNSLERYGSSVF